MKFKLYAVENLLLSYRWSQYFFVEENLPLSTGTYPLMLRDSFKAYMAIFDDIDG